MDAVHLPLDHIHAGYKLGARGRKGNAYLRGEGILPPKGICARLFDRLEPSNNAVGIRARENFPERGRRRGGYSPANHWWNVFHGSSCEFLLAVAEMVPRGQARKSSSLEKKEKTKTKPHKYNKRKEGQTKWKERKWSGFF